MIETDNRKNTLMTVHSIRNQSKLHFRDQPLAFDTIMKRNASKLIHIILLQTVNCIWVSK